MTLILTNEYPGHDPEQHLRDFSRWSNTLGDANVGDTLIIFKHRKKVLKK